MNNAICPYVIGIDVGGANLKFADTQGHSLNIPFAMWTEHARLGDAIADGIHRLRSLDVRSGPREVHFETCSIRLAVTMTGELADCFANRRDGVAQILRQVAQVVPESQTQVYAVNGQWLHPQQAAGDPWSVAASNWHALATWVGSRLLPATTAVDLLVDIGSTTVDVIPMHAGAPATPAATDRKRMQLGQLVYTGMRRTPVAAITHSVQMDGQLCPLMAERFATSDDAYLVLALVDEDASDCDTADGRPRTRSCAYSRLARMVGEDYETLRLTQIEEIAIQLVDHQARQIAEAIRCNLPSQSGDLPAMLVSGHGRVLLERVLLHLPPFRSILWLEDIVGKQAARCSPALAVAHLLESSLS